jgi:hypothetical protein
MLPRDGAAQCLPADRVRDEQPGEGAKLTLGPASPVTGPDAYLIVAATQRLQVPTLEELAEIADCAN